MNFIGSLQLDLEVVMKLQAAFIFLVPEAEQDIFTSSIETNAMYIEFVGVKDYATAEQKAVELAEAGVGALELCAGFGNEGVARIAKAVGDKAVVGAVRFDFHPGLGFKSGDGFFA